MSAKQIAEEIFGGSVDEQFVRRRVPGRIAFGKRMLRWYEHEVLAWIDSKRRLEGSQEGA